MAGIATSHGPETAMPFRLLAALCFLVLSRRPSRRRSRTRRRSKCMAIARRCPDATYASFTPVQATVARRGVITYAGHSTYVIETPAGVRIATDFSGVYGADPLPRVVTMNKAHRTPLHRLSRSGHRIRAARLESGGRAGTACAGGRRRLHPQRADRHPQLGRRAGARRQLDLHLRGRGPVHRPSRPSASPAGGRALRRHRPARHRHGADRRRHDAVARAA